MALLKLSGRPLLTRHAVHLLGQDQEFPATAGTGGFGFAPQVSVCGRDCALGGVAKGTLLDS